MKRFLKCGEGCGQEAKWYAHIGSSYLKYCDNCRFHASRPERLLPIPPIPPNRSKVIGRYLVEMSSNDIDDIDNTKWRIRIYWLSSMRLQDWSIGADFKMASQLFYSISTPAQVRQIKIKIHVKPLVFPSLEDTPEVVSHA